VARSCHGNQASDIEFRIRDFEIRVLSLFRASDFPQRTLDWLTIDLGRASQTRDGIARRDFPRVGALSLGGLSLPMLLAEQARAATGGTSYVKEGHVDRRPAHGKCEQVSELSEFQHHGAA
jgi:hypothetical protein